MVGREISVAAMAMAAGFRRICVICMRIGDAADSVGGGIAIDVAILPGSARQTAHRFTVRPIGLLSFVKMN
jgi:hypothetical protein